LIDMPPNGSRRILWPAACNNQQIVLRTPQSRLARLRGLAYTPFYLSFST